MDFIFENKCDPPKKKLENIEIFVKFERTVNHLATQSKILKKGNTAHIFVKKHTLFSPVTDLQNIKTHLKM